MGTWGRGCIGVAGDRGGTATAARPVVVAGAGDVSPGWMLLARTGGGGRDSRHAACMPPQSHVVVPVSALGAEHRNALVNSMLYSTQDLFGVRWEVEVGLHEIKQGVL